MFSWLKLIKQAFVSAASSMEEEVELPPDVGDILLPLAVEEDECCDVAAAPPAVGSATLSQAAEEGGDCLLPPAVGEEDGDCDCFLPPAVDEECDDLVLPGDDCYNDLPGDVGLARAQRVLSQFGPPVDVMEIFCPPRLNAVAAEYRLRPGPSIDLLSGFDLSLPSTRAEVAYIQSRLKPRFLLTCAPCKLYSQLQAMWNVAKVPPEVMRYRKQKADELFNFGLESLERQEQWSGLGLHEHPAGATSWRDIDLNISRFFLIGYACTVFDFCLQGCVDPEGLPVRKRTRLMSNCKPILEHFCMLCRPCDTTRPGVDHRPCWGSVCGIKRSEHCQVYPPKFCCALMSIVAKVLLH